ncbi:glycosyltransferase family 4 protein [Cytobacillus sp.]|uniref:glycosyltransferase family 4 protein n=1 Tax=Cytobacillus sp. TaxID=2675269 RepID=UPI0028BD5B96|nr:glycosyltransferase family 4 protein [Cytobacillus sp.]
MKILWVINIPMYEASILMGEPPVPYGGWLIHAAAQISQMKNVSLEIAFPYKNSEVIEWKGEYIKYYSFPPVPMNNREMLENNYHLEKIMDKSSPDIVHIFGTEFAHTLAMVNICKKRSVEAIISIQGLVSVIATHYTLGLPMSSIKKYTFRDFIKRDNIYQQQKKFMKRGEFEIEAIKNVSHIIGRTTWDRACTTFINKEAKYYYCNESLRDSFYQNSWSIDSCEKYSIFLSQGSYPIKGLHFVIEAMRLILKRFPETKLYIGGENICHSKTVKEKLRRSFYGKYINDLIKRYALENHVSFTGVLNEQQMCDRYLHSHVFVCPSTIENSPNSLGEAMILGVPSVASDVGGVSDLLTNKEEGFLYQADAPYMLAYYICEIFGSKEKAVTLSERARRKALMIHDREKNLQKLVEIYTAIWQEGSSEILEVKGNSYEAIG